MKLVWFDDDGNKVGEYWHPDGAAIDEDAYFAIGQWLWSTGEKG